MADPDEFLDADAVAANRKDARSAAIVATASLAVVVIGSIVVAAAGYID